MTTAHELRRTVATLRAEYQTAADTARASLGTPHAQRELNAKLQALVGDVQRRAAVGVRVSAPAGTVEARRAELLTATVTMYGANSAALGTLSTAMAGVAMRALVALEAAANELDRQ